MDDLQEIMSRNPNNVDIATLIDRVLKLEAECHRQSHRIISLHNHILELKRERLRMEHAMMMEPSTFIMDKGDD